MGHFQKYIILMKVMLFAAGLGTRLRPLTDTMPKAMVPVEGRPLIAIVMNNLIRQGATEIVINVHHFAQQIIDFIASQSWRIPVKKSYYSRYGTCRYRKQDG